MIAVMNEPTANDDSKSGKTTTARVTSARAGGVSFVSLATLDQCDEASASKVEITPPSMHATDGDNAHAAQTRGCGGFARVSTIEDGDEEEDEGSIVDSEDSTGHLTSSVGDKVPHGASGSRKTRFQALREERAGILLGSGAAATTNPLSEAARSNGASDKEETSARKGGSAGVAGTSSSPPSAQWETVEPFRLFGQGDSLAVCTAYGMLAISQQMGDEALPLFMKLAQEDGGFGYSESDIGASLAVGGIATTLISLYVVPHMERKWGAPFIFRLGLACMGPMFSFFWIVGMFWPYLSSWAGWLIVSSFVLLKNTFLSISFAGCFVMMTNSVPQHHLGTLNGIGQTFGSLSRTIGPALCGLLWSIGVQFNFIPLTFFAIGASCTAALALSSNLPPSLRYPLHSGPKVTDAKAQVMEVELV